MTKLTGSYSASFRLGAVFCPFPTGVRAVKLASALQENRVDIQLSIGMPSNSRTWPLLNGQVKAEGIDLIPSIVHPSELFWRQLHFADFDVSEMSFSSVIIAISQGDDRWVGIPIFTTRRFFHTGIMVRRDSGIVTPADLKGRRVGVPEYQHTAALWNRGILQHEFGVSPTEIEFWMERMPDHSHGSATGFKPPPGVTINQIPAEKSIGSMMVSGELEAALHYVVDNNLVDRSKIDLANHPDVKMLFPDPIAEGARYFAKTGIYPINHGMAIKRGLAERHPWLVLNLLKAFRASNDVAEKQRIEHVDYHRRAGLISLEAAAAMQARIVEHGVVANRHTLQTVAQNSFEQGLTQHLVALDEVFAASTMDE
jgi:4,5-dihydroxyphthalate decarboxylase